jgi:hypothetical protein
MFERLLSLGALVGRLSCRPPSSRRRLGQGHGGDLVLEDVTDPFKKAFEKANPSLTLEVQNRNTNAGVKFIEETKANNQADLFWASPGRFEVLKPRPSSRNTPRRPLVIPEKVGSYPINDRDGFYVGFAASATASCGTSATRRPTSCPSRRTGRISRSPPSTTTSPSPRPPARHHPPHHRDDPPGRGLGEGLAHDQAMAGNFNQITERSLACPTR